MFAQRRHMWHDRLQVYDLAHTVRRATYRYTVYLDRQGRLLYRELFDYHEDPLERETAPSIPTALKIAAELTGMIDAGWRRYRPIAAGEEENDDHR